jgi:hypothetical protein
METLDSSAVYQIKVQGRLDDGWSDWFDGMSITFENGTSVMVGAVVDQAALHGVLVKIRDMHLTLISVTRIEAHSHDKEATHE